MTKVKVIGKIMEQEIPAMGNGIHHRGGPRQNPIFGDVFAKLPNLKAGEFLVVTHDSPAPSDFHGRFWMAARKYGYKRGQFKISVRLKKAYIGKAA